MIQAVWAKNQSGQTLELELRTSGTSSGIYVFNLEGIGSPVATINSSGGPALSGVRVNSRKIDGRHLTFSVAINSTGDEEETARALLYQLFPVGEKIFFGIRTDRRDVYTEAYVEQNPFAHFSKIENSVISLLCPSPFLQEVAETSHTVGLYTGVPEFSFPFSNESLLLPLLKFGTVTNFPTIRIDNDGVKTGVEIDILFLQPTLIGDRIGILNTNGDQHMHIYLPRVLDYLDPPDHGAIQAGDRIHINTKVGEKEIKYIRSGESWKFLSPANLLSGLSVDSTWITINPGRNQIVFIEDLSELGFGIIPAKRIEATINYHKQVEGV